MTEGLTKNDKKWNLHYEKLVAFQQTNGHLRVPKVFVPDKSLGNWVNRQQHLHASNKMGQDRKNLLVEIGFVWRVDYSAVRLSEWDKKWHQQYKKLVELKRKNGHCMVPFNYELDKSLGRWVGTQRDRHGNNKMQPDRKELLDEIGFVWKVDCIAARVPLQDKKWHQQYEKLVEFKRKNGHCIVPHEYEQDTTLGNWVSTQRYNHTKNKIRQDRKELLDEIGLVWTVESLADRSSGGLDKKWHQQYQKLVEFKRKNGHCIVPRRYEQDKALGKWVDRQRCYHTKNKIRQDRKELLDELGFVWNANLAARSSTTESSLPPSLSFDRMKSCDFLRLTTD